MTKIKSWLTSKATAKNSKAIQGRGIFAKEKIKKGEKVLVYGGAKVDRHFAYFLDRKIGDYQIQISDSHFIGPLKKKDIRRVHLINHSCSPNLGFTNAHTLVAICDIDPREELTFDYAFCTTDSFWMRCQCKSANCRGVVTGDGWQNKKFQEKYRAYFTPHVQGKIRA